MRTYKRPIHLLPAQWKHTIITTSPTRDRAACPCHNSFRRVITIFFYCLASAHGTYILAFYKRAENKGMMFVHSNRKFCLITLPVPHFLRYSFRPTKCDIFICTLQIILGQFDFFTSVASSPFQQQPNGYSLGHIGVNGAETPGKWREISDALKSFILDKTPQSTCWLHPTLSRSVEAGVLTTNPTHPGALETNIFTRAVIFSAFFANRIFPFVATSV